MAAQSGVLEDDVFSHEPARLGALIRHVERFEAAGEPEPWMTTIGHGPAKLPVRLRAATHA